MRSPAHRRQAGFSIGGLLALAVLGFSLYSAYCFFPAYFEHSRLESAVGNILKHGEHVTPDRFLRAKTQQTAASMDVRIDESLVRVRREKSPGKRIVHIEFEMPVSVTFLGQDRTWNRTVHANYTYAVNEAADSQRIARDEAREADGRRQQLVAQAGLADYRQRVIEECDKGNTEYTYSTHVFVTFPDGSTQNFPCSVAYAW